MRIRGGWVRGGCALVAALGMTTSVHATTIVNDSWADGGKTDGADALDTNWWTSASSAGIEVSTGSLGMVTGTSGRGIHTVFPTQTLSNVGDKLIATYTFTTPATVGTAATAGFRVGLFDTLGRAGLNGDVSASSGSPNSLYGYFATSTPGLPGFMMDMDVGTGAEDISFRKSETAVTATTPTGRLMGTTTGFTQLSPTGPDGAYAFAANTTYTGSFTITRTSATDVELAGALGSATHTLTTPFESLNYGMLAFWANSNVFGSASTADTPNNGIDFSNIKIEFVPVPEPSSVALLAIGLGLAARRRR